MSLLAHVAAFTLRHSITGLPADQVVGWVSDRFRNHADCLPQALDRANARA